MQRQIEIFSTFIQFYDFFASVGNIEKVFIGFDMRIDSILLDFCVFGLTLIIPLQ